MKIVKKGRLPKPWVGRQFQCEICQCVFELEDGDPKPIVHRVNQRRFYVIGCPDCHEAGQHPAPMEITVQEIINGAIARKGER